MDLMFRLLKPQEIECRIGKASAKGLSLLLYKNARCDMQILDETVGAMNWERIHTNGNANCTIAIYDSQKGEWVTKEDVGTPNNAEKEKSIASDSFKRAAVNWGIGRELYSAPFIWISSDKVKIEPKDGKFICNEKFIVSKVEYDTDRNICLLEIQNGQGNPIYTFKKNATSRTQSQPTAASNNSSVAPMPVMNTSATHTVPTPVEKPSATASTANCIMPDSEVLLLGNCKGLTYGEAKTKECFKVFLKWILTSNASYVNPKEQEQYLKLKAIAGGAA